MYDLLNPSYMFSRKLLVFFIALLISFSLSAQDISTASPFPLAVGGGFSFRSVSEQNDDNERRVDFKINPTIAYQVSTHWQVGASLNYNRFKSEYTAIRTSFIYAPFTPVFGEEPIIIGTNTTSERIVSTLNSYGIGLFARYAFNPQNQVRFIVQPQLNLNTGKLKTEPENNPDYESRTRSYSATVRPGVIYAASPRINLVALLGNIGVLQQLEKGANDEKFEKERFETFASLSGQLFFGAEYRF